MYKNTGLHRISLIGRLRDFQSLRKMPIRERIQRQQKILLNWQVKMNLTLPAGSLCWQGTVTLEVYATPMQVKV